MYQILFKYSKRLVIIGALLINSLIAHGQDERVIDSLKTLVGTKYGVEQFDIFYDLTFEYLFKGDNANALRYIDQAKPVAYVIGDSLRMVKASRVRSQILSRMQQPRMAIDQCLEVLEIARRNQFTREQVFLLNTIGEAYTWQSDYDKALEYHYASLVVMEKTGQDTKSIYEARNNIGVVYYKLKDYERALEYYFLALELEPKLPNNSFTPSLLNNIGLCFNQLQRYDEAREYIERAFDACGANCSDQTKIEGNFGLGVARFGQASAKKDTTGYGEARKYFIASLSVAESNDDKRWQVENLIYLGTISLREKNFNQATVDLSKAEKIAVNTDYKLLLIEIYRVFSTLYNEVENYPQAAGYQDRYIHLKDSVFSESLIKNLSKVTTQYEERENIATIKANQQVIKQQRDLNVSFAIIALLAGLLILLVQRSNRTIKRVNVALSDAKNTIEEQNAKLQILNTDLDAEVKLKTSDLEKANQSLHRVVDELDNFIYKTSHDIRGPLASLKGICNIALLDVKDDVALKYLHKLDVTAEKLNTILTRLLIVNQINNSSLKIDELINFDQVVNDVLLLERKKGLPPRLKIEKFIEKDISFFSDKEFVRIILENLIDNAIKFYNDSDRVEPFVRIYISGEKNQVLIRVVDNGIGISEIHPDKIFQMFSRASERSETGGIGLFITKTATEKLGGSVSLKTTPEGYTEFFVRFSAGSDGWRK